MGDAFQRIFYGVCKGVHRVNAPFITGIVVVCTAHTVDCRVAHVDVRRRHIDFSAQHHAAVGMFAVAHFTEARQVFSRAAVAEW